MSEWLRACCYSRARRDAATWLVDRSNRTKWHRDTLKGYALLREMWEAVRADLNRAFDKAIAKDTPTP